MKKIVPILLSIMILTSCSIEENYSTIYEVRDSFVGNILTKENIPVSPFNTMITLRTFCEKDDKTIFPVVSENIQFLHMLFDRYNSYVYDGIDLINLKSINDSYATGNVLKVDKNLIELLKLSIELSSLTEGYFNPTLGNLIDTWNYYELNGKIYNRFTPYCLETPDVNPDDVSRALKSIIPYNELEEYIVVDELNNTVEFKKYKDVENVKLSLGAIAKGFAIESAKKILQTYDIPALIDGGSSSSYGLKKNPNPDRDTWIVGIASPYKDAFGPKALINVEFNGTYALSVSGDYENCYFFKDENENKILRHHILNPYTGYPELHQRVVSIWSDSRTDVLDGLSTAIFNISEIDEINEIIDRVEASYNIDIEYLLEREADAENSKVDLYITIDFGEILTAYNKKIVNEIIDIRKEKINEEIN